MKIEHLRTADREYTITGADLERIFNRLLGRLNWQEMEGYEYSDEEGRKYLLKVKTNKGGFQYRVIKISKTGQVLKNCTIDNPMEFNSQKRD